MPEFPFTTYLSLPPGDLTGKVHIKLAALPEDGEHWDEEDYAGAISLLTLFAQGVNAQLFRSRSDRVARLTIERAEWNAYAGQCEMVADAENVAAYAWIHLLAMLQKNHDALEPLESATIWATGDDAQIPWESLRNAVPQNFSATPLPFVFEENGGIDKTKNLNIELEFENDLSEDIVSAVTDDFMTWMQFAILGAFDGNLKPGDDLDPLGTVKRISSIRMQCFMPYFNGDMSGFAALEHLLRDIHRRFPLVEVEIT